MFGKFAGGATLVGLLCTACSPNVPQDKKSTLKVGFQEDAQVAAPDLPKIEIPDPPTLPAVPPAEPPCDDYTFSTKNYGCRDFCPTVNPPPAWLGCHGVRRPSSPAVTNSASRAGMPCTNPKACAVLCPDPTNPDPGNPICDKELPVTASVIKMEVQSGDVLITIAAGSDQNVAKGWMGTVSRGDSEFAVEGGEVVVIRVGKRETVGKVHLAADKIRANPRVKLWPPPI